MTSMKHFSALTLAVLTVFSLFIRCSDDDTGTSSGATGTANFELTDGPIDDANIKAVFVTVTAVKVDGEEISGFTKQTIDLLGYQNGNTKLLGSAEIEAKKYDDVSLVLDFEADVNGNSPGSYILTNDGKKHSLQSSSDGTIEVETGDTEFTVEDSATTTIVLDFDVRKAIKYESDTTGTDDYDFVTNGELNSALRAVIKSEAGMIQGNIANDLSQVKRVVVYAYAKGEFDKDKELEGSGSSDIQFKNAVSSTVAKNGSYTLAFLEEGDYELHFFGYGDANNDNKMEVLGELNIDLLGTLGIDLNNVTVGANATVSVSVVVLGILP